MASGNLAKPNSCAGEQAPAPNAPVQPELVPSVPPAQPSDTGSSELESVVAALAREPNGGLIVRSVCAVRSAIAPLSGDQQK